MANKNFNRKYNISYRHQSSENIIECYDEKVYLTENDNVDELLIKIHNGMRKLSENHVNLTTYKISKLPI